MYKSYRDLFQPFTISATLNLPSQEDIDNLAASCGGSTGFAIPYGKNFGISNY